MALMMGYGSYVDKKISLNLPNQILFVQVSVMIGLVINSLDLTDLSRSQLVNFKVPGLNHKLVLPFEQMDEAEILQTPSVQTTARWLLVLLSIFRLFILRMDFLNDVLVSRKFFLWRLLKKIQN